MIELENRMVIEGQRYQEDLYGTPDEEFFGEEDEEDGGDEYAVIYYERQGDEYVYYDSDDHELYREPV